MIFSKSRFHVATPSRWLMEKVERSMLTPAIVDARVIPNGVDLSVFRPSEKQKVREALVIPENARVLLFTAKGIRKNIWKDYDTLCSAVTRVAERMDEQEILFIALGEDASGERIGNAEVRFVPFQGDPEAVARYYQSADIYLHAARADTFPNTILEALACGTPVVATAIGGIPEQIEDGITGFLTPPGDAQAMASRVMELLENEGLRLQMGANASEDARRRFGNDRMVGQYVEWYGKILERQ